MSAKTKFLLFLLLGPFGIPVLCFLSLTDSCSCIPRDPAVVASDFAWETEAKKIEEVTPTPAKPETDYEQAYREANTSDKPLFVLVGTEWCPPCKTMQLQVIPELQKSGALNNVVYCHLDADADPQCAGQLMTGTEIPQFVIYRKVKTGWKRRFLIGAHTAQEVRSFINQN